jgi:hypothetical protein
MRKRFNWSTSAGDFYLAEYQAVGTFCSTPPAFGSCANTVGAAVDGHPSHSTL